jgi:hypothetical protein
MTSEVLLKAALESGPFAGILLWLVLWFRSELDKKQTRNDELYERIFTLQKEVLPVLKDALDSSKEITVVLDRISRRADR